MLWGNWEKKLQWTEMSVFRCFLKSMTNRRKSARWQPLDLYKLSRSYVTEIEVTVISILKVVYLERILNIEDMHSINNFSNKNLSHQHKDDHWHPVQKNPTNSARAKGNQMAVPMKIRLYSSHVHGISWHPFHFFVMWLVFIGIYQVYT